MSSGNGRIKWLWNEAYDPVALEMATARIVRNRQRDELTANAGIRSLPSDAMSWDAEFDPRRSVRDECGWPSTEPTCWQYQALFNEDPIANRVVTCWPAACWQVQPEVWETDEDVVTPFEKAVDELGKTLRGEQSYFKGTEGNPLWGVMERAHVLSRIGQYGVIHVGFDDGQDQSLPVPGVEEEGSLPGEHRPEQPSSEHGKDGTNGSPKLTANVARQRYKLTFNALEDPGRFAKIFDAVDGKPQSGGVGEPGPAQAEDKPDNHGRLKVIYLRPYSEAQAQVSQWETNRASARFDQPVMYRISLNDPRAGRSGIGPPQSTINVHWTRVIHVPCNPLSSEVLGVPAMRPVVNDILDLRKIAGASAEGYWKNGVGSLFFETHPQLGGQVDVDDDDLRDMAERMENSQQKYGRLTGMSAKAVARDLKDPAMFSDPRVDRICIALDFPKRIFIGSERGELASSQDDSDHNDDIKRMQNGFLTPRMIVPFFDRLIQLGALPKPSYKPQPKAPPIGQLGKTDQGQFDPQDEEDLPVEDMLAEERPGLPKGLPPAPSTNAFPPAQFKAKPFGGPPKPGGEPGNPFAKGPPKPGQPSAPGQAPPEQDPSSKLKGEPPGVKPEEEEMPGYHIEWPDVHTSNDAEKADVANKRATAMATYIQGTVNTLVPEKAFLVEEMGYTDEQAEAFLEEGEMKALQQEEQDFQKQKRMLDEGLVADPNNPDLVPDNTFHATPFGGPPKPEGGFPGAAGQGKAGGPPKPSPFGPKKPSPFSQNVLTANPFVSEAQHRACYAKDDPAWDCKEWEEKTKNAFCPGKGAEDNSCSSHEGGDEDGPVLATPEGKALKDVYDGALKEDFSHDAMEAKVDEIMAPLGGKQVIAAAKDAGFSVDGIKGRAKVIEAVKREVAERRHFHMRTKINPHESLHNSFCPGEYRNPTCSPEDVDKKQEEYGDMKPHEVATYAEQFIEDARLKHRGEVEGTAMLDDMYGKKNGAAIREAIMDVLPPAPEGWGQKPKKEARKKR